MHIPDGMLSPSTSAAATVAMLPVWAFAARRVRASLGARQIPLLSLGAAFCFTIMMFNVPAPGGTTAHPVAGTLLAVTLGPYAACIGISVALAIQALFFGDGGLLAYGANCFTMAFALPFVGYSVYRALAGRIKSVSLRAIVGGIAAYVGLNAAAALVAVLLGIQPALFHEPNGHALYFPFGLQITLPAMLSTHLLIAGPAEAIVTGLVLRYLQAAGYPFFGEEGEDKRGDIKGRREKGKEGDQSKILNPKSKIPNLAIGLLALVALSPLGLLAKGEAWGEWDAAGVREQIKKTSGQEYVPQGIAQAEEHAYKGVHGLEDYASNEGKNRAGYVGAGFLGAGMIALLLLGGGRLLIGHSAKKEDNSANNSGSDDSDGGLGAGSEPSPLPSPPSIQENALSELPAWLRQPSERTAPPDHEFSANSGQQTTNNRQQVNDGKRSKSNPYIERTLSELAHGALVALQGERWARQPGYLQRIDPRAKVLTLICLIAVVTGLHNAAVLLAVYALALGLAVASRLPLGMMLKRVWLTVPLFAGALTLPAALNVFTPGHTLLILWAHPYIAITQSGLMLVALLTLRVGVAITLAALLTLTTPWNDLLRALRVLFLPRLFISVLAMTYRYLTVLMQSADDQFVARRSRTVGRSDVGSGRRFVAAGIGALFGRTLALSEEVYGVMLSRGFNGEMQTLNRLRWKVADTLWTAGMTLLALLCVGSEHVR